MWHIAGGIILAVIILAFWPFIAGAGLLLLLAALAVGGVVLIFTIEGGRETIAVIGGLTVGIVVLGWLFKKTKDAGGLDILLRGWIFELRPAITERQKIQKIADRDVQLKNNQKLKLFREKRALKRQQEAEAARLEKAKARMVLHIRRLEKKFARAGQLKFDYSDPIRIYSQKTKDYQSEEIARLGCYADKAGHSLSYCYYELETAPRFSSKKLEVFTDEILLGSVLT